MTELKLTVAVAFFSFGLSSAFAAESARLPASGAAFCPDLDELKSYMMALLTHDKDKVAALPDCLVLKGNLKIDVLDDTISDPSAKANYGMWIDKVRVYLPKRSVVGYASMSEK